MASEDEREQGEQKKAKALSLLSEGKLLEADALLHDAEQLFRASGHDELLPELLLAYSQIHLRQGLIPQAHEDIDRAVSLAQGQDHLEERSCLLFQRGLVSLNEGKEIEAHQDMTKYLELAEGVEDDRAQIRAHFYLALTYERHGEPCMAATELELGKDIAIKLETPHLVARLTAFFAHLWLRREVLEEAEAAEATALQLIEGVSIEEGGPSLGFVLLVNAELQAVKSNWDASLDSFNRSIRAFQAARLGHHYFDALAHAWYGETIMRLGRMEEGCHHIVEAWSIFERLSNESQVERIKKVTTESVRPINTPGHT